MYYYDPNNDKSNARRWASLAALLYALSIAAAFLFVSFDMGRDELLPGEGLLIDFGTTETGLGDRDLSATDVQAPPQQAAAEAARQQVEYVTSEREEIAVQTPQPESTIPDLIATFYVTYRYSGIFRGNKQFFKSLPALRFRNRRQKHLLHGNSPFSTVLQQFQYAIHMVFIWVRYKHTA